MKLSNALIILFVIPLINCCSRIPEEKGADKSPSDGRYRIIIYGNPQFYQPYQKYNVTLMGTHSTPVQTFIGFMLAVELDNQDFTDAIDIRSSGTFDLGDSNHEIKFSEKCRNLLTHTNTLAKSKIQVVWTAPPPGSGCVNFRATVIQHRDVWYMDDGFLTKNLCEEQQDDIDNQPVILEECCACDEAKYQLTFESKWSRHTHPKDFPVNSWIVKFSDIIGASHNINYMFWKYGEVASEGVRHIGEHGVTDELENELLDELDNIRTIIKAKGIPFPTDQKKKTDQTNAVFRVDAKHHVISLISMIQPSPDWIVGVSGLELCLPNCTWVEEKIQNLYPWDIGTDKGPSYDSPDQPQIPPDVIRRIKSNYPNDPRSPFYDAKGVPMKPLARLYVTRVRLYEKPCDNNDDRGSDECATHPWSKWSDCDAKCGRGKKIRITKYKNEEIANRFGCDKKLFEEQTCYGDSCGKFESPSYGGKNRKIYETDEDNSPDCALSDWSDFSECSSKCGKGTQTKSRYYLNPHAKSKCEKNRREDLEITEPCRGTKCGGNNDDRSDNFDNNIYTDRDGETNSRESPSFGNGDYNNNDYNYNKYKPSINKENTFFGRKNQPEIEESYENKGIYNRDRNNNYDNSRCEYNWKDWDECDATCGEGRKRAYRFALNRRNCQGSPDGELEIQEICYGKNCEEKDSRQEDRETRLPRHCKHSEWSEWGPCNATCDFGLKARERTVWNPNKNKPADSCGDEIQYQYSECFVECEIENKFCYEPPNESINCRNLESYWYYNSEIKLCALFFTGNCMEEFYLNKFDSRETCRETCKRVPINTNENMRPQNLRLEKIDCISKWISSDCFAPCGEKGFRKFEQKILQHPKYGGKLCAKESVRFEECYKECKKSKKNDRRFY